MRVRVRVVRVIASVIASATRSTTTFTPTKTALHAIAEAARNNNTCEPALHHIGGDLLSYGELWHDCACAAHTIARTAQGQPVATLCDEAPHSVIALLSISIAGCIIVPLDPASPTARLQLLLEDSSVVLAICETVEPLATELASPLPLLALEEAITAGRTTPLSTVTASADDVHHLIYTSGSTGMPKAVVVTHRSVASYCAAKARAHSITPASRVLLASAHTWDPFLGDVLSTLAVSATLISAARASVVHDLGATLRDGGVTHVLATPSLWSLLSAAPHELPSLECVALGGEPLPHALGAPWLAPAEIHTRDAHVPPKLPLKARLVFANTYGVTEATVYNTFGCMCAIEVGGAPPRGSAGAGWPLAGVRIGLVRSTDPATFAADDGMNDGGNQFNASAENGAHAGEAPDATGGTVGEILIGGVQVGVGYHRRPELSASRFVDAIDASEELIEGGASADDSPEAPIMMSSQPADSNTSPCRWFRTGDLGVWRSDGLHVLGRMDAQIKLHGHRIELGEVEAAARTCEVVAAAAATVLNEVLYLFVVPAIEAGVFVAGGGETVVRLALRRQLPQAFQPARVLLIKDLPLTPGGKLRRSDLPAPPARSSPPATELAHACGRGGAALRGRTEVEVARAWSRVLGVARVGPHDNFFELGGSSFHGVRMLRVLQGSLGDLQGEAGDAFERGNQRFATRLCGLYRKPRLRDYCVWLEWAALAPPIATVNPTKGSNEQSSPPTAAPLDISGPAALLAAGDAALPESADLAALATEALGRAAAVLSGVLVRELLAARALPNGDVSRKDRGLTPLMHAVSAAGSGPCEELTDGTTAEVVALLLAAGASVNLASPMQQTVAHLAAARGDLTTLTSLLRAGAIIHARDMNKWSTLFHAAHAGSAEAIRLLVGRRADVHARDRWGYTPLCWSASGGHAAAATALLAAGALADGPRLPQAAHLERHNQGDAKAEWNPPLHLAVRCCASGEAPQPLATSCGGKATDITGGVAVLRLLLAHGANANRRDQSGRTALDAAVVLGCKEAVALLRKATLETPEPARATRPDTPEGPLTLPSHERRSTVPLVPVALTHAQRVPERWAWPPRAVGRTVVELSAHDVAPRSDRWAWPPDAQPTT